jgi:hypothetical protein
MMESPSGGSRLYEMLVIGTLSSAVTDERQVWVLPKSTLHAVYLSLMII